MTCLSRRRGRRVVPVAIALLVLLAGPGGPASASEARRIDRRADAYLHYSLGRLMEIEGMQSEALVQYRRAASIDPGHCELGLAMARTLAALGRLDTALETVEAARGRCPESDAGIAIHAQILMARGEPEKAEEIVDPRARPSDAPGQLLALLGHALIEQGRADEAEILIGSRAAADSLAPNLAFLHASALLVSGREDEALSELHRARRLDPENRELDTLLGYLLIDLGRPEEGIPILEILMAQTELPEEDHTKLAWAYVTIEQHQRALEILAEAEEKFGRTEGIMFTRARLHSRAGAHEEAFAAYEELLELDPDSVEALNEVAYFLAVEDRDLDRALSYAVRAAELDPENQDVRDTLGWCYFQLGRFEEALPELERAIELGGPHPVVLEHLGDTFAALGRNDDAVSAWSRALSLSPGQDSTRERLEDALGHPIETPETPDASETPEAPESPAAPERPPASDDPEEP